LFLHPHPFHFFSDREVGEKRKRKLEEVERPPRRRLYAGNDASSARDAEIPAGGGWCPHSAVGFVVARAAWLLEGHRGFPVED